MNRIFYQYLPENNINIGETYSVTFEILSDTHFTDNLETIFKKLNEVKFPLISFINIEDKVLIELKRPKLNFFSPSEDPLIFKFKFEEIIKDYVIGLSIISRGIFFPFRLGGLKFDYELKDSELGKIDIKILVDGIRPTKYKKAEGKTKKKMHLYHFIFPLLWSYYREKLKWEQIHYFYGKALILLSQYDIVDRFFDEIFMLFYKIFENISTFDILKKSKLSNELKELQSVVDIYISEDYLKSNFKNLYILRCKVLAHSQNAKHELATFNNVLEMKKIVDITISRYFLTVFLNDESFKGINPSSARI
ncbi:hypothetical protein [Leptospira abararensis]|uniref:hypothetical protein n=1 Tax=Leptospira abararensis TaxID=2810036 RepID=UPI00196318B6|nr:hypothetical protein [Leptospira abararensis]